MLEHTLKFVLILRDVEYDLLGEGRWAIFCTLSLAFLFPYPLPDDYVLTMCPLRQIFPQWTEAAAQLGMAIDHPRNNQLLLKLWQANWKGRVEHKKGLDKGRGPQGRTTSFRYLSCEKRNATWPEAHVRLGMGSPGKTALLAWELCSQLSPPPLSLLFPSVCDCIPN